MWGLLTAQTLPPSHHPLLAPHHHHDHLYFLASSPFHETVQVWNCGIHLEFLPLLLCHLSPDKSLQHQLSEITPVILFLILLYYLKVGTQKNNTESDFNLYYFSLLLQNLYVESNRYLIHSHRLCMTSVCYFRERLCKEDIFRMPYPNVGVFFCPLPSNAIRLKWDL